MRNTQWLIFTTKTIVYITRLPVHQVVHNPCTTCTKGMTKTHSTTMNIHPELKCVFKKCKFSMQVLLVMVKVVQLHISKDDH